MLLYLDQPSNLYVVWPTIILQYATHLCANENLNQNHWLGLVPWRMCRKCVAFITTLISKTLRVSISTAQCGLSSDLWGLVCWGEMSLWKLWTAQVFVSNLSRKPQVEMSSFDTEIISFALTLTQKPIKVHFALLGWCHRAQLLAIHYSLQLLLAKKRPHLYICSWAHLYEPVLPNAATSANKDTEVS